MTRRDRVEASADAILAALREHGGEDVPQQVLLDAQLRDGSGLVDVALVESLDRLKRRGVEVVRLRNGYPVEVGLYMHHPITYTIQESGEVKSA
jgi:hypothetical protein